MRVLLCAGFDRSELGTSLAELAARDGTTVAGIVVASGGVWRRGRALLVRRDWSAIRHGIHRIRGSAAALESPLRDFRRSQRLNETSLAALARRMSIPYLRAGSINAQRVAGFAKAIDSELMVYTGGGIIRQSLLDAMAGKVVNAHHGPLPHVRGMNALEWSLWLGLEPTVTLHYVDAGIDTGPIIRTRPLQISRQDSISAARERAQVAAIELLRDVMCEPRPPSARAQPFVGTRFFEMAPALKNILQDRIYSGRCSFAR